jgi:phosphatidylglycerol lysyltransferase
MQSIQPTIRYRYRSMDALATVGRSALALALAFLALANLVNALVIHPWAAATFGEQAMDLDALGFGRADAAMLSAILLLVARALAHGKRQAWWLSLFALGCSAWATLPRLSYWKFPLSHLTLVLLVALLALAPLFSRRSDPRALWRGYVALAAGLGCVFLLQAIHHYWHPTHLAPWQLYRQIMIYLLRAGTLMAAAYGVVTVLRPVRAARQLARDERARALAVVRRYGTLSTAHFAMGEDKSFYWSGSGQAFVAYRLINGVALVLGDPVGPSGEGDSLLRAFVTYCRAQDWTVAWYLASPRVRVWCRRWGMSAHKIGEEAEIDVDRFTMVGKIGAPVRHSVTRARRGGMRVHLWQGEELPDSLFAGMKRVSSAWQTAQDANVQMGFSMGRFPADWSPELLTAVACDAAGEVQAFLTWTPLYRGDGWSLDAMRRAEKTEPGTMEFLIAESIAWARERGYHHISLGLVPLAGLGTDPEVAHSLGQESTSALERIAGSLQHRKLFLANYSTLLHFKAKFQPAWEPR